MNLTIFSFKNLMILGGSTIRTLGYSYFLKDSQINVDFFNPYDIPKSLKKKVNFNKFKTSFFLEKILSYYCLAPKLLFFIKYIIWLNPILKEINSINNPIIFHQNFKLGLFSTLVKNKICIYDIHGIIDLQREYLENSNLRKKCRFFFDLIREKNYFKYSKYFIVSSKLMKKYLIKRYNIVSKNIFIGEEGFLDFYRYEFDNELEKEIRNKFNLLDRKKIIFFAGDFKKFGGVYDLVEAFYIVHKKEPNTKLFLIGSGQEEKRIGKFINDKHLKNEIIITKISTGRSFFTYQKIADIIICPDNQNYFNEIVPHVKLFDSLASGKPLVISDLKCLSKILDDFSGIELFKPGNISELAEKILKILTFYNKYFKEAAFNKNKINAYKYKIKTKSLIQQINKRFY